MRNIRNSEILVVLGPRCYDYTSARPFRGLYLDNLSVTTEIFREILFLRIASNNTFTAIAHD